MGPGDRRLFRILRFRPDPKAELDAELEFHFTEMVEALLERGWTEREAREEARRRFGDVERYRTDLERIGRTKMRRRKRMDVLDVFRQNLLAAFRGLRREPGFSAAVVVTLALGIGANATMFGVVDRLLLSPPEHIESPDQVRRVLMERFSRGGETAYANTITWPDYLDLVDLDVLDGVAAYAFPANRTMGEGEAATRVRAQLATASYFRTLGVEPVLGRFYDESEDVVGAPLRAVISEHLWERHFGRDPDILGRILHIGEGRYEVVGVAPAGFTGAGLSPVELWLPIQPVQALQTGDGWIDSRNWWWISVVVRLADGVSPEAASARMTAAHRAGRRAWEENNPSETRESHFAYGEPSILAGSLIEARTPYRSATSSIALWLTGVSLVVLLIACANVANLLLTRGVRARREHAVRVALGVSRGRLLGQLLTEALVLSGLGAVAAWLVARWSSGLVHGVLIPGLAPAAGGSGLRFGAFLAIATALTALLAGVLPALQASHTDAAEAMRAASQGNSGARSRLRGALTVSQTTLSVLLLVGAGLFVKSLLGARSVDPGFDTEHTVRVTIELTGGDDVRKAELYEEAALELTRLSFVRTAAATMATTPFSGAKGNYLRVPGLDSLPSMPGGGPYMYQGSPGFLEAMGVEVVRGRSLQPSDHREGAEPVMLVNRRMDDAIWPEGGAIGQCAYFGRENQDGAAKEPCRRIVGVFEDPVRFQIGEGPAFAHATPAPTDESRIYWAMIVRTEGDPTEHLNGIREAVIGTASDVRYVDMRPFADMYASAVGPWRLGATMFTAFGLLALFLAAMGLYSVLAFGVVRGQRELGIRAALGASGQDLIWMVVGQAGRFVGFGLILGLALAWGLGGFVEDLLFGIGAQNLLVYGVVTATLLVTGVLAAFLPARRATQLDPTRAIQAE